ncbi:MAG: sugar ABC transporter ATP-binding protein [Actinobacteria bacterium]|nr:sugar ABC transporter ATP-binding protein [Actinomycetota bacterium]
MDGVAGPIVEFRGIVKNYPGTRALDGVSMEITHGSVHGLVGANGAGKSTLGKVLGGATRPDDGRMFVEGRPVKFSGSRDALQHGIARVAQELALVPRLNVMQNVFLGVEPKRRGLVLRRKMRQLYDDLVGEYGFALSPYLEVGRMRLADQQKVEILRAVNRKARLIIMDEPTSSLTKDEVITLHEMIRHLNGKGTTVIYVSHFLDEVLAIADTVTVMRNGQVVRTSKATEETPASLVGGMFGCEAATECFDEKSAVTVETVVLEATDLCREKVVRNVSLAIRSGEIVGLAGLVGSGRSEVARAICGVDAIDGGTIKVDGVEQNFRFPRDAFRAGVAFVPESRKQDGLCMQLSLRENTTLPHLWSGIVSRAGVVQIRSERSKVESLLKSLSVEPPRPELTVESLSGGNQQKVVFGKCLFRQPRVLILDEPTRGVDVDSRANIHRLIQGLARQGVAILLISSDIEEVLGLSHRVLVMRGGEVVREFPADPSMGDVMNACFGLATSERECET